MLQLIKKISSLSVEEKIYIILHPLSSFYINFIYLIKLILKFDKSIFNKYFESLDYLKSLNFYHYKVIYYDIIEKKTFSDKYWYIPLFIFKTYCKFPFRFTFLSFVFLFFCYFLFISKLDITNDLFFYSILIFIFSNFTLLSIIVLNNYQSLSIYLLLPFLYFLYLDEKILISVFYFLLLVFGNSTVIFSTIFSFIYLLKDFNSIQLGDIIIFIIPGILFFFIKFKNFKNLINILSTIKKVNYSSFVGIKVKDFGFKLADFYFIFFFIINIVLNYLFIGSVSYYQLSVFIILIINYYFIRLFDIETLLSTFIITSIFCIVTYGVNFKILIYQIFLLNFLPIFFKDQKKIYDYGYPNTLTQLDFVKKIKQELFFLFDKKVFALMNNPNGDYRKLFFNKPEFVEIFDFSLRSLNCKFIPTYHDIYNGYNFWPDDIDQLTEFINNNNIDFVLVFEPNNYLFKFKDSKFLKIYKKINIIQMIDSNHKKHLPFEYVTVLEKI